MIMTGTLAFCAATSAIPNPSSSISISISKGEDSYPLTICPAPTTPNLLISAAAAIELELNNLVCLLHCSMWRGKALENIFYVLAYLRIALCITIGRLGVEIRYW